MASRKAQALVSDLLSWYDVNARDLPWRRTKDPYAIHVSEIMLQQTQVKTVIPFWNRWMQELPTIVAAARVSSDKLHKLWEGLGYYTRVRNLQKAAQAIVEQHGGKFPETFDEVLELPGIGRYTAGAICSIAFNQPTPLLDGNVIRVFTRIFGIAENPKDKVTNTRLWKLAEEMVGEAAKVGCAGVPPEKNREFRAGHPELQAGGLCSPKLITSVPTCSHLNQSLMELGALVCTPRNPQCLICPVKKLCVAFREGRVEELPNLGKRAAATARHFVALAMERDGRFLVRQRPAGVVNGHLWEFPNVELIANGSPALAPLEQAAAHFGMALKDAKRLCVVKHSITRYRITLEAWTVRVKKDVKKAGGSWKTLEEMRGLAFTSAHGKILKNISTTDGHG